MDVRPIPGRSAWPTAIDRLKSAYAAATDCRPPAKKRAESASADCAARTDCRLNERCPARRRKQRNHVGYLDQSRCTLASGFRCRFDLRRYAGPPLAVGHHRSRPIKTRVLYESRYFSIFGSKSARSRWRPSTLVRMLSSNPISMAADFSFSEPTEALRQT